MMEQELFGKIMDVVILPAFLGVAVTFLKSWRAQGEILQRLNSFAADMETQRKELQRQIKENSKAIANEREVRNQHVETKIDNLTERIIVMETILKRLDERNGK